MKKEHVLARLKEDCLVAVVRAKNYEQGEKVVDAIIEGGINFIELTMTMDDGDPVGFIKKMADKYKDNDKIVIGAGTDHDLVIVFILVSHLLHRKPRLKCRDHQALQPLQSTNAARRYDSKRSYYRYGSWMRCNQDLPRKYRRTCSYQLLQGTSATG